MGNEPAKVLVVHDDPVSRAQVRAVLDLMGAQIVEAGSAPAALAACLEQAFALILLKQQLPGMDGRELDQLIRQDHRAAATPILFLASQYEAGAAPQADSGPTAADDAAPVAIDLLVLRRKAQVFLEMHRRREDLRTLSADMQREYRRLVTEVEAFRAIKEDLRFQSSHDALTRLPNRLVLEDRLEAAVKRSERQKTCLALLFADLDNLKPINDQHGHQAGDELLVAVAQRLAKSVRATDTVARIGGDEFVVLLESLNDPQTALAIAQKIYRAATADLSLPTTQGPHPLLVTPGLSIGVALCPQHSSDPKKLLALADQAMYAVKAGGVGGVRMYDPAFAQMPRVQGIELGH